MKPLTDYKAFYGAISKYLCLFKLNCYVETSVKKNKHTGCISFLYIYLQYVPFLMTSYIKLVLSAVIQDHQVIDI